MANKRMGIAVVVLLLAATGAWALASGGHAGHGAQSASAGAGVCEMCQKPLVAARVVSLQRAGERTEHQYRCIHCALVAARDWQQGDLTLRTKSAEAGQVVTWRRTNGKWSASPSSAVVLAMPEVKGECLDKHVVLASAAELKAYQGSHAEAVGKHTLPAAAVDRILAAGRGPLPKEATCPVTGEKVKPTASTDWTVYQGKVYYFCCGGCKPRFVANAAGYVSGKTPKLRPGEGESCGGHGDEACECPSQKGSSGQKGQPKSAPHHTGASHT